MTHNYVGTQIRVPTRTYSAYIRIMGYHKNVIKMNFCDELVIFTGSKYAMFSMKVTVSMILQKYILRTEVKLEDIRLSLDLLMRSVHGYKIKLYSRKLKI